METNISITNANSLKSERGAALMEMALMVALVAVMGIVSLQTLGNKISQSFTASTEQLSGGCVDGQGAMCSAVGGEAD